MNFHAFLQEMLGNSCCSIRSFTNAKVHICLSLNPEAAPWVGPRPAPPLSPGHSGAGSAWPQAGSALRSPQREKRKLTIRGTHEIEVREALCSFTDSECKDIITGCNLFQALWFSSYFSLLFCLSGWLVHFSSLSYFMLSSVISLRLFFFQYVINIE